jgi:hypothetical protein
MWKGEAEARDNRATALIHVFYSMTRRAATEFLDIVGLFKTAKL